jgi:hypothetical protein
MLSRAYGRKRISDELDVAFLESSNPYQVSFAHSIRTLSVTEFSGRRLNYSYGALYRLTNQTITSDPVLANNGAISYT